MTHTPPDPGLPRLTIIFSNSTLANSLASSLSAHGLNSVQQPVGPLATLPQTDLLAWISSDFIAEADTFLSLLSSANHPPSKIIITFPADPIFISTNSLREWIDRINGYMNEIIKTALQKQLDLRFIAHHSIYTASSVGEGSALSYFVSQLKIGNILDIDQHQLHPVDSDQAAESIISVWFDRGHKYQRVLLRGQPVDSTHLKSVFSSPQLSSWRPLEKTWLTREQFPTDDIIEIKSDTSTLNQLLTQSFLPIAPHSQPNVATPSPVPVLSPAKTVVSPIILKPRLPYLKYGLIAILSTFIAYIAATYGLFALALFSASRFNPEKGDQINKFSQSISSAAARYHKLSILTSLDGPFERRYISARKYLLQTQAKHHAAEALTMILDGKEGDPYQQIAEAQLILAELYPLETQFPSNPSLVETYETLRQLLTLFPQIFPADQKITILVLLQNNLELRPTGGFIGSIALATMDRGKILNLDTRNIYDLDSNLRGLVTPPQEVSQYLGESSWYFRDSNWNPDFVESAQSANWFLDKEWGSRSQVVIGINLNSFKNILSGLGGVTLTTGASINPDNLLVTALNSQDSVASTSANPDLVSLLVSVLPKHINQANSQQKINLLSQIYQSILAGEITISSINPGLAAALDDLRLSGSIYTPPCPPNLPEPCFADHFYLNEANVGINKANYYLTRRYSHQTVVSSANITHTHQLSLQNTSPNTTWPAGSYKAYYRAFLPFQATNIQVTLNGQALGPNQQFFSTKPNVRIVGWYHQLEPQASLELSLSYQLPLSTSLAGYQLFIQKQPGLLPADFSFNFSGWSLPLSSTASFNRHLIFPIKFSP